jgi:phosphate-selective porin OprO/OprP
MRRLSEIPLAVLIAFLSAAGPIDACPVNGQEPAGQTKPKEGGKPREGQDPPPPETADKPDDNAVRFVWKSGPSLRVGKDLRVDFRLKLQADFRDSGQDLEPAGGLLDFPRRRVGIKGHVFRVVEFEVERDLVENGVWRDVYVNLRPFDALEVKAGKFKIPFSREQLTSSYELDFMYRSLAAEILAPNRDVGIMLHGRAWHRFVSYEVGTFRGDGENTPNFEPPPLLSGDEIALPSRRSFAGRVVVRPLVPLAAPPIFETLEVGASAMRSELPEGLNHLQGETLFGTRFFSRGYYVNGPRTRAGLEASWSPGPASLGAEYLRVEDARLGVGVGNENGTDNDLPPLPARGWYVYGTWALTGEKKAGGIEPRRPFPLRGPGAIEVAARYEELRFGGGDTSEPASRSPRAANAAGNAVAIATLGVNWYVNRFVRVQLNGIRERVEDPSTSPLADRAAVWTVACRLQFVM